MPQVQSLRFRVAGAADATEIAALHADSWRRHYRGVHSDSYLDGDVAEDRLRVWSERLAVATSETAHTVVAEDDDGLVGFTHVVFDADPQWGALLDNLHVRYASKRQGVGSELVARSGRFRQQQQKNDVDGFAVDGIEVDGSAQARQQAERFRDLMEPRMGYRHAAAHAGRAEFLTLNQLGKKPLGQHVDNCSRLAGEL